jgi:hypothetical protein
VALAVTAVQMSRSAWMACARAATAHQGGHRWRENAIALLCVMILTSARSPAKITQTVCVPLPRRTRASAPTLIKAATHFRRARRAVSARRVGCAQLVRAVPLPFAPLRVRVHRMAASATPTVSAVVVSARAEPASCADRIAKGPALRTGSAVAASAGSPAFARFRKGVYKCMLGMMSRREAS